MLHIICITLIYNIYNIIYNTYILYIYYRYTYMERKADLEGKINSSVFDA